MNHECDDRLLEAHTSRQFFNKMIIILHPLLYQALLEVHDAVAFKTYASPPPSPALDSEPGTANGVGGQPIRMVGLHKQPNKPLVSCI